LLLSWKFVRAFFLKTGEGFGLAEAGEAVEV
jgi:hypothetical protein